MIDDRDYNMILKKEKKIQSDFLAHKYSLDSFDKKKYVKLS